MENLIAEELELAKNNMFEEISYKGKTLVALTKKNVALVEAMIRNDSAYKKTFESVEPDKQGRYKGSSAFWMTELRKTLCEEQGSIYNYHKIIQGAVEAVDRENRTHLNADNIGRNEVVDRIENFDRNELLMCLKNPDYDDMKLFRVISDRTSAKLMARTNLSFASKFCHYACFIIFQGTKYQDNYSIYDSVLKSVLPMYLDYYGILEKYDLKYYKDYRQAIDRIREHLEVPISRNGFDHLLWYYHKGR